ncbi:hypothetical protein K3495_g1547 [Podosphaera aphanis]|nr:hypothetical protein K3495_g1547 [Podosphaera aphanis]
MVQDTDTDEENHDHSRSGVGPQAGTGTDLFRSGTSIGVSDDDLRQQNLRKIYAKDVQREDFEQGTFDGKHLASLTGVAIDINARWRNEISPAFT